MKNYPLAIVLALLVGCASAGFRYHTLQPAPRYVEESAPKYQVRLTAVYIPAEVDTDQLVVRMGNNTLAHEPADRWAAPLTDEIRGALDDAWRRDYGLEDVQGIDDPMRAAPQLEVKILKLDATLGSHVEVVAEWRVSWDGNQAVKYWSCQRRFVEHADAGINALVDAQQRVFHSLASEIGASVITVIGHHVPSCAGL